MSHIYYFPTFHWQQWRVIHVAIYFLCPILYNRNFKISYSNSPNRRLQHRYFIPSECYCLMCRNQSIKLCVYVSTPPAPRWKSISWLLIIPDKTVVFGQNADDDKRAFKIIIITGDRVFRRLCPRIFNGNRCYSQARGLFC